MTAWVIRDGEPSDHAFIVDTWTRWTRENMRNPKDWHIDGVRRCARALVPIAMIRIACIRTTPFAILGYALGSGEPRELWFAFTRFDMRGYGIKKGLMDEWPSCERHL